MLLERVFDYFATDRISMMPNTSLMSNDGVYIIYSINIKGIVKELNAVYNLLYIFSYPQIFQATNTSLVILQIFLISI